MRGPSTQTSASPSTTILKATEVPVGSRRPAFSGIPPTRRASSCRTTCSAPIARSPSISATRRSGSTGPAGVSARGPLLPRLGRSGGHAQTPSGSGDKMDKDKMMDKKQ